MCETYSILGNAGVTHKMGSHRKGYYMSYGKFVATGCIGIIFATAIVHVAWFEPQIERKAKLSELVNSAHSVQAIAANHYVLEADVSASTIDLQNTFPYMTSLNNLLTLSAETGFGIETGFSKDSMGNALALSNYVLTGEQEPKFLNTFDIQHRISARRLSLMDSVPLWPW